MRIDDVRSTFSRRRYALGLWALLGAVLVLPGLALAAPPGQQAPTPTQTPTAQQSQPTATRPAKPLSGLVLVPLTVRPGVPTPGSPPEATAIKGRVFDSAGHGLWGQVVKVTREGFTATATTGDDGAYEVGNLAPGTYSVVVEKQICTPADGVKVEAGKPMQVDFVQIRPAPMATYTPTRSAARTAQATPSPTATRTPRPEPTSTPRATPTPTPRPAAGPPTIEQVWNWLGLDLDLSALASHLYLGVLGGALLFAAGLLVALVRR